MVRSRRPQLRTIAVIASLAVLAPMGASAAVTPATAFPAAPEVVPNPVQLSTVPGAAFSLTSRTQISVPGSSPQVAGVAGYLATILRHSTGYRLPITTGRAHSPVIVLNDSGQAQLGQEGYRLDTTKNGIRLRAHTAEGLFRGVQTLRQLLPARVEASSVQAGPWVVPGVHIEDKPRYAWRGAMLDVARHFFTVAQVERYLDLIALYKVNTLHLHLSDDQGWRIAIKGLPKLTTHGGSTEVGGGTGGYYTQQDYSAIVRYAASRYITIVPEIDGPGHVNAALSSDPPLNCDGKAPPLYTGTDVGFSSLCTSKKVTYTFLNDVIGQIAALTPGPYFDIGGDEAQSTKPADYVAFVDQVEKIVHARGKKLMGWQDIAAAKITSDSIAQFWQPARGSEDGTQTAREAVAQGAKLVMSPADHAYLDMKYTESTPLGQDWAGLTEVRDSYDWNPGTLVDGVTDKNVLGVEAPLWTETIVTNANIDYMAFPRLAAIAEIGWSPQADRSWTGFRTRLAAQGPRWTTLGVDFYRSPQIPWPAG